MDKIKKSLCGYLKSIDEATKTIIAYVSTYEWDRMDERFVKGSWDLTAFQKNPVVLWAHNKDLFPIAKCTSIVEDETGLMAEMQFDQENEFSMQIFSMYQRGFLSAFSVGFWPDDFLMEEIEGKGYKGRVWTKSELLEFSAVPVPANPGALMSRESAQLVVKALGNDVIDETGGDGSFSWKKDFLKKFEPVKRELENPEEKKEEDVKEESLKIDPNENEKNLEVALKSLIDLAKVVKKDQLDPQKITLVKSSMSVLQEIISESKDEEISGEDLSNLKEIVDGLLSTVSSMYPDQATLTQKFTAQLDAAMSALRTN